MLSIIINHNNNPINYITKYISFLQNIIQNYNIQLLIINCNNEINDIIINNINPNLIISIYNYSCEFNDSIYNDILNFTTYDNILFTTYNTFFTNILFDWIYNNTIDENSYIKTNIFTVNSISEQFFSNFSNSIYNHISSNINTISNELGIFNIDSNTYIDIFNNNKDLHILDSKTIIENNTLFIHNTNDFLLINKNTIINIGFNIDNSNSNYTFQYLTLQLIKNNLQMIKLPYLISIYKQFTQSEEQLININSNFNTSSDYNKFTNYKIYNLNTQKTSIFIRNQVKTIKGYNTASTVQENESLKHKINQLNNIIDNYKNKQHSENIILDSEQKNKLTEHNNQLTQENNKLTEHNNQLIQQNNKLTEQNNQLTQQNNQLTEQNKHLQITIQNKKNDILIKLYDIINCDLDK